MTHSDKKVSITRHFLVENPTSFASLAPAQRLLSQGLSSKKRAAGQLLEKPVLVLLSFYLFFGGF